MTVAQFFYAWLMRLLRAVRDSVVYATWKKTGKTPPADHVLQNLPLKVAIFLRGAILTACLVCGRLQRRGA
jgi:GPH family glycoside/pentoside/hexuronide:cation symporter